METKQHETRVTAGDCVGVCICLARTITITNHHDIASLLFVTVAVVDMDSAVVHNALDCVCDSSSRREGAARVRRGLFLPDALQPGVGQLRLVATQHGPIVADAARVSRHARDAPAGPQTVL